MNRKQKKGLIKKKNMN